MYRYKHMRVGFYFLILCFLPRVGLGQASGIKFEDSLTWNEILAKAKTEKKLIFMDCFATWCAPCKYMANVIFPQKSVGEFFNEHFVSVTVQMDRTDKDSARVRQWYQDAKIIEAKYAITAFPTYLFFSANGEAIDRITGSLEANEFILRAKDALLPQKQYYGLINSYEKHLGDSAFLRNTLERSIEQEDPVNAEKIAICYMNSLKEPLSHDNVKLFLKLHPSIGDEMFIFLLNNATKIDQSLDGNLKRKSVEWKLSNIVVREYIDPLFKSRDTAIDFETLRQKLYARYPTLGLPLQEFVKGHFKSGVEGWINKIIYIYGAPLPDWSAIERKLVVQFPGYDYQRVLAETKPRYYLKKSMWLECEESAVELLDKFGDKLTANELNNITWDYICMHSSKLNNLRTALRWSRHSVEMNPRDYDSIDTYANLLYKTGNHHRAEVWEAKAIKKCELDNDEVALQEFRNNLKRMQKGE